MIIVTTNDLPDYKIDAIFGEVMGLTVRSRHIGAQFTEAQTKVAIGTVVYTMPLGEGQSGATGQSTYLALNPQG